MAKEVAVMKWIKISKMQQQMLLAVLLTSILTGVALVLILFFVKNINFNARVIGEKNKAIVGYEAAIKNSGLCVDKNKDGRYNDKEINDCVPSGVEAEDVPGSLRHNIIVNMAKNKDLESVGRDNLESCYDLNKNKIDFEKKYLEAENTEEKTRQLYMMKMCSALRVVPDALPSSKNEEALMSSLNKIFKLTGAEPSSLSPNGTASSGTLGMSAIPVSLTMERQSAEMTLKFLKNIEKSIRTFDISTASFSWTGGGSWHGGNLEMRAQAASYYIDSTVATEVQKTIYASDAAKKIKQGNNK